MMPSPQSLSSEMVTMARNRFLGALPPGDFDLVASHLVETVLQPGALLQEAGEPVKRVSFPCSGLVSLVGMVPEGHVIDTVTIGREGAIGLSAAIGSPVALNRAVVQLPGRALQIPLPRLAELADRSRSLRGMIVRYGEVVMAQVQQTVVCNTVHPVQARLCRWLLQARDRTGSDSLDLTQELLSGLLGVQRTTITLVSRLLQAEGILHVRRGRMQICDAAALESKACSCYRIGRRLGEQSVRGALPPAGVPLHNSAHTDPGRPGATPPA